MGYLMIDHRAGGGVLQEYDTVNCKHCQAALRIIKGQAEGYFCMKCMGPICETCAAKGICTPLEARVEEWLKQQRRERYLRSIGVGGK